MIFPARESTWDRWGPQSEGKEGGAIVIEGLIGWVVIGVVAGSLAGLVMKDEAYGAIQDVVIGILGAVLGGWASRALGVYGGGLFVGLAGASVGALVCITLLHTVNSKRARRAAWRA